MWGFISEEHKMVIAIRKVSLLILSKSQKGLHCYDNDLCTLLKPGLIN